MQSFLPRTVSVRIGSSAPRSVRLQARSLSLRTMAAKEPIYEIAVKGDPKTGVLGDCPFSHRALLTLEEKKVPYTLKLVDFDNKPQWLLDANPAGSVPVLRDIASGTWTPDSGAIVNLLEEKFPEIKLGTAESAPQVGNAIFGAFKDFAKSTEEDKSEKEAALLAALDELETYLQQNGGPFVGGTQPSAADVSLMPKLYHAKIALEHFRGWHFPSKFTAIRKYMDTFMARDSWKNTHYSPELVIKGWIRHGLEVKK